MIRGVNHVLNVHERVESSLNANKVSAKSTTNSLMMSKEIDRSFGTFRVHHRFVTLTLKPGHFQDREPITLNYHCYIFLRRRQKM